MEECTPESIIQPERYDALVQAAYAGPIEPRPWSTFLQLFRSTLSAIDIGLTIQIPRLGSQPLWLNDSDTDPDLVYQYHQIWHSDDPWRSFPNVTGTVATLDEVISPRLLRGTLFFQKFMVAHGAMFGMKAVIECNAHISASLLIGRTEHCGNFSATDRALAQRLLPHLRQSLRYYQQLAIAELQQKAFSEWLQRSHRQLFWLNRSGRLLLKTSFTDAPLLKTLDGRLRLHDAQADARLQDLIGRGLRLPPPKDPVVLGAVGLGKRGDSILVQALPIDPRLGNATPCLALFLSAGSATPVATAGLIADIFDLTNAEARLALLLTRGLSLKEAAIELNLSEHTVRTQAKSIYRRMDCPGQSELMRRVLTSVAAFS